MKHNIKTALVCLLLLSLMIGCKKSILDERALTFLSPDALRDKASYEAVLVGLHVAARNENFREDGRHRYGMDLGTDVMRIGDPTLPEWKSYPQELTPTSALVNYWWNWGFLEVLPRANAIISNVQTATTISQADRNALEAEARFFRAYMYNAMVNIYGGVPIVDKFYTEPKVDFTRASRDEVLAFVQADLEFAAQHLPATAQPGRITKGAANHLLSEVYISRKNWDKAIEAASAVIDGGQYSLMQQNQRFGKYRDSLGTNIFWDLFREGNYNAAANREDIWVVQFEVGTPGGGASTGIGNNYHRGLARWFDTKDPNNANGMLSPVTTNNLNRFGDKIGDSLTRGVGWLRPTDYWTYNIWTDPNDIRNSNSNIRRKWYYNNPASAFRGQEVTPHRWLDTMFHLYPIPTKFEGITPLGFGNGQTGLDQYKMRLAETYLLRAEAYLGKGNTAAAAADINVVRSRAGAAPVAAGDVTIDYILDERARELFMEEPRRRTLVRLGKLVERTRTFNSYVTGFPCPATGPCNPGQPGLGTTIQAHHELFPIPQSFISANVGAVITQNPGYN
jgi:hypothetical protein